MKSTKVQNPRRKCSAVVEMNCLVAEYRIPYRIGPRTIITRVHAHAHRTPLIDGLCRVTWSATKASSYLSQASYLRDREWVQSSAGLEYNYITLGT